MGQPTRTPLPPRLLAGLDDATRAAVTAVDPRAAATAILDLVEAEPPFSSRVVMRSAWLKEVRACLEALGSKPSDGLGVRMLSSIARTAFAARETTAGLAAADAAYKRAVAASDAAAEVMVLACRLPFVARTSLSDGARDAQRLADLLPLVSPLSPQREAEVRLAFVAWHGTRADPAATRRELIALGKVRLPQEEGLVFVAYASQVALAQMYLRSGQRVSAVKALIEAARLADEERAFAELANLQATIAAIAVQAGDFRAAVAHARSALDAAERSTCQHAQPDPWLGLPIDVNAVDSAAAGVHCLAEAVLTAQDWRDATGFLAAVTAMAAFYLADDRALEALDGLKEATEAARSVDNDGALAVALRGISESLLQNLRILKR
jgi:hypothetical protein